MLEVERSRKGVQDIARMAHLWDIIVSPTFDILRESYGSPLHPVPVWRAEETAKYLKGARPDRMPVVLFGPFDNQSRYSGVVENELRLWLAGALANGASFWDCTFVGTHKETFLDQRNHNVAAEYFKLLEQAEDLYIDSQSVADVVVMHSQASQDMFGNDDPRQDGYGLHFEGIELALFDNHIPFDIIPEARLTIENLAHYRTLILPNTAVLSDEKCAMIREYVRAGGGLVATYETSLYLSNFSQRTDFGLGDVFGAHSLGTRFGPMRFAYTLIRERNELTAGLEQTQICANEGFIWFTQPLPGANTPATLIPEIVPQPPELAFRENMETSIPVLITNHFGQGRSVFFPGQTDKLFASSGHPDYGLLLCNAIHWAINRREPLIETNAPAGVHISITFQRQKNRMLVHLINYIGSNRRPITQTLSLHDIKISISKKDPPARVYLLSGLTPIPFQYESGRVHFSVPVLNHYEAIVLE